MSTRNFLCGFPAPVPVGHRVEVTVYESIVHVEAGVFSQTEFVQRNPAPYLPLVRDLETGIVYADEAHFENQIDEGWTAEGVEAHRTALRAGLVLSAKLTPVETVQGRVTECAVIGNVWVYADDRRAHTRLVIALEAVGYRG